MRHEFRWNAWNLEAVTKHLCTIEEVESVVENAGRGFPRKIGGGKLRVEGRGHGDRFIEVIYVLDNDGTVFVIHAMPLTTRRRQRRR
jgi:hypothetical protein